MESAIPGVRPPAPLGPETPPYVAPPAEREDQQAPEPTRPPEDLRAQPLTTPTTQPGTTPTTEGGTTTPPAGDRPSTTPLQPGGPTDRPSSSYPSGLEPSAPSGTEPGEIPMLPLQSTPPGATPATPPAGTQPFGEPTGDFDPPPAPPKIAPSSRRDDIASGPRLAPPKVDRTPAAARRPAANDPPPALPGTFASVMR
jgi:hypothetical protein